MQKILDEQSVVVGESQIIKGQKTVLLEQVQGENFEKTRHVALKFNFNGIAEIIGVFDEFKISFKD